MRGGGGTFKHGLTEGNTGAVRSAGSTAARCQPFRCCFTAGVASPRSAMGTWEPRCPRDEIAAPQPTEFTAKRREEKKNKKKQNQNNFLAAFSRQPEMEKTRMRPGCLHSASWMQARTRPSAAGSKGCAIEPWGCPSPPPPFPSFLSQCNLKKAKTEQKRRA